MELKRTRKEIVSLAAALANLDGLKGVKLCYAISKSIDMLSSEVRAVAKANEVVSDYSRSRDKLGEKYAAVNEDGSPMRNETGFLVAELTAFHEEHDKLLEYHAAVLKELEETMNEEITVEVHAVSKVDVPDDISLEQMRAICLLIE